MIKKKQGVALLWAVILSSVLLLISGTMVSYIVRESQFSIKITDSNQAFAYAKSGIEWGIDCYENNKIDPINGCNIPKVIDVDNDGTPETTVTIFRDSPSDPYSVSSESNINNVLRKLVYQIIPDSGTLIQPAPTGNTPADPGASYMDTVENLGIGDNSESFTLQFDFWLDSWRASEKTVFVDDLMFGINGTGADPDTAPHIAFRSNYKEPGVTRGAIELEVRDTEGNLVRSSLKYLDGTDYNLEDEDLRNVAITEHRYRVYIKYIENIAVSMKLTRKVDLDSNDYNCVAYTEISLSESGLDNFGNLNTLYWWEPLRNKEEMMVTDLGDIAEGDERMILLGTANGSISPIEYTRYRIDSIRVFK